MKISLGLFLFFMVSGSLQAQVLFTNYSLPNANSNSYTTPLPRKLYQRNYGAIVGLQRGKVTSLELGGEMHWRKIALRKPTITGATANLEYNFGHNVLGYKAGVWKKTGRVNLTYGGNVVYFTNFKGLHQYGLGPAVGFRFAGFHFVNGYNILVGKKESKDENTLRTNTLYANTLYVSLRYYFPVDNKFTWDRETMRKKRVKQKERAKRQEEREAGERWNWRKPFHIPKKED